MEKNKIINFISHNNTIKSIENPLSTVPMLSAFYTFCYVVFFLFTKQRNHIERATCIIGIILSISMFVLGILVKKKYRKCFEVKPGECMCRAEVWQYTGISIQTYVLMMYISSWEGNLKSVFVSIGIVIISTVISIIVTFIVIKIRILNDVYRNKKMMDTKVVAFFSSGAYVAILMVIKNIVINNEDINGPITFYLFMFMISEAAIILATVFYIKIKYAKKYGLEEYLPTKSNPK